MDEGWEHSKALTAARGATLLACGLTLGLTAGCSQPKGPASPSGSGSSTAQPAVIIGQITPGTSQAPLFVAASRGFFTKAGIDVTIQNLSGGTPAAMASFASGGVNMLAGGAFEVIEYVGRGVIAGKIVGELADQNYDIVTAKGITALEQLKGKTIGISGANGADQLYLRAVAGKRGMSDRDFFFITSGATANRLVALSTGVVQAIVVSNASRAMSNKVGAVLVKSSDSPVAVPGSVLFANSDLVANHKAILTKIVGAIGDATQWMRENPTDAASDCAKGTGATVDECARALAINLDPAQSSRFTWSATNAVNISAIDSALKIMAELVPETHQLGVDGMVDTSIAGTEP